MKAHSEQKECATDNGKKFDEAKKAGKLDGAKAGSGKPQDNAHDNTTTKHSGKPEEATPEGESS